MASRTAVTLEVFAGMLAEESIVRTGAWRERMLDKYPTGALRDLVTLYVQGGTVKDLCAAAAERGHQITPGPMKALMDCFCVEVLVRAPRAMTEFWIPPEEIAPE